MTTATIQQTTARRTASYDNLTIALLDGHDDVFLQNLRELDADTLKRNPQGEIVLCDLKGSDKQIEWAFDIRKNAILKLQLLGIMLFRYLDASSADDAAYETFRDLTTQHNEWREGVNSLWEITSAKWWIDNRQEIGTATLTTAQHLRDHADSNMRVAGYGARRALDAYNTRA